MTWVQSQEGPSETHDGLRAVGAFGREKPRENETQGPLKSSWTIT